MQASHAYEKIKQLLFIQQILFCPGMLLVIPVRFHSFTCKFDTSYALILQVSIMTLFFQFLVAKCRVMKKFSPCIIFL